MEAFDAVANSPGKRWRGVSPGAGFATDSTKNQPLTGIFFALRRQPTPACQELRRQLRALCVDKDCGGQALRVPLAFTVFVDWLSDVISPQAYQYLRACTYNNLCYDGQHIGAVLWKGVPSLSLVVRELSAVAEVLSSYVARLSVGGA